MGLITKILEFARTMANSAHVSEVKNNPGGGALQTSEHFQDPNTDSHPLPDDFALLVSIQGTGRYSVAGYADPKSAPKAQAGEWRAYARKADGGQAAEVWIKNDGTVVSENDNGSNTLAPDGAQTMQNANGYIKLLEDGTVDINGYIIGTDGNGTTKNGISQDDHTHAQGVDSAGNTQAETEKPTT